MTSRRPETSLALAAVIAAGILLGACSPKPTEGGPLWVSPDASTACAPRALYPNTVWGTPIRNDASTDLTISSVAPSASSHVSVGRAYVVYFSSEAGLLLQALPLNDAQQEAWAKRTDAIGATLKPGDGPTIVLEVNLDPSATTANIAALLIRYRDASGTEYVRTTNEGLEFKDVC